MRMCLRGAKNLKGALARHVPCLGCHIDISLKDRRVLPKVTRLRFEAIQVVRPLEKLAENGGVKKY
jgi:hypothetical protein